MTLFEPALYDGSDPLYAPGRNTTKDGRVYWRPSKAAKEAGCDPKPVRLMGKASDGMDAERASECRRLTRESLEGMKPDDGPRTWGWLIGRYRNDPISPYQDVKPNTREGYDFCIDRWSAAVGHMMIGSFTYEKIKEAERAMKEKGRSTAYISRMFNTLRRLARYGAKLRDPQAREVAFVMSETTFKSPPKRQIAATREQVRAIVDAADAVGQFAFATGILMQWAYGLRAVDVRGQWFVTGEGRRWADGLTWDMVDRDFGAFTKVISKTSASLPEPIRFNLAPAPELRARLRLLHNAGGVGPVITSERTGQPFTTTGWTHAWARHRKTTGVDPTIWMMDTRAGAITEGSEMGADVTILRDAAGHQQTSTTNRYLRGREGNITKLAEIRAARNR